MNSKNISTSQHIDKNELFKRLILTTDNFKDREVLECRRVYGTVVSLSEFSVMPELNRYRSNPPETTNPLFDILPTEDKIFLEMKVRSRQAKNRIKDLIYTLVNHQAILRVSPAVTDEFDEHSVYYVDHNAANCLLAILSSMLRDQVKSEDGTLTGYDLLKNAENKKINDAVKTEIAALREDVFQDIFDAEKLVALDMDMTELMQHRAVNLQTAVDSLFSDNQSSFLKLQRLPKEIALNVFGRFLSRRSEPPYNKYLEFRVNGEEYYILTAKIKHVLDKTFGRPDQGQVFAALRAKYGDLFNEDYVPASQHHQAPLPRIPLPDQDAPPTAPVTASSTFDLEDFIEHERGNVFNLILSLSKNEVHSVKDIVLDTLDRVEATLASETRTLLMRRLETLYEDFLSSNNTAYSCFKLGWNLFFVHKANFNAIYESMASRRLTDEVDIQVFQKLTYIKDARPVGEQTCTVSDKRKRRATQSKPIYLDFVGEKIKDLLRGDVLELSEIENRIHQTAESEDNSHVLEFIRHSTLKERLDLINHYLRDWYRIFAYFIVGVKTYFVLKKTATMQGVLKKLPPGELRDQIQNAYAKIFSRQEQDTLKKIQILADEEQAAHEKKMAGHFAKLAAAAQTEPILLESLFTDLKENELLDLIRRLQNAPEIMSATYMDLHYYIKFDPQALNLFIMGSGAEKFSLQTIYKEPQGLREFGLRCAFLKKWGHREPQPYSRPLLTCLTHFRTVIARDALHLFDIYINDPFRMNISIFQSIFKEAYAILEPIQQKSVFAYLNNIHSRPRKTPADADAGISSQELWSLKSQLVKEHTGSTYDRNGHYTHSGSNTILNFYNLA